MSAIASFYLLSRPAIPGLAQAAKAEPVVTNYLQENDRGVSGGSYDWSGYALFHLLCFLEESGTPLGTAEYRAETEAVNAVYHQTYLVTSADKRHLPALDPARLDRAAAERYFGELGYAFEQLGQAVDDGLLLLHRLISALNADEVLVINIR